MIGLNYSDEVLGSTPVIAVAYLNYHISFKKIHQNVGQHHAVVPDLLNSWLIVCHNYSDEVLGSTPNFGKKERLKFFWGYVRMVEVT